MLDVGDLAILRGAKDMNRCLHAAAKNPCVRSDLRRKLSGTKIDARPKRELTYLSPPTDHALPLALAPRPRPRPFPDLVVQALGLRV